VEPEAAPECAICLTHFAEGDRVATLPCHPRPHAFHEGCIVPWLRVSRKCPLCTQDIAEPRGDEVDEDGEVEGEGVVGVDR